MGQKLSIPFKPPKSEVANSQKASDAVAIQLMEEFDLVTLSDLVLPNLTQKAPPNDSDTQLSLKFEGMKK